jgi:hypothetical protein
MKKIQLLSWALVATAWPVLAQTVISDSDLEAGGSYTWTADNEYLLDGLVFLEAGGTLTIEAGTVIKGIETPTTGELASALIISQGAKIYANGTAEAPVIFTAELDDLSIANDLTYNDRGFWGGLLVLGYASIGNATATAAIEGIPTDDARGTYGGDNDADNSGSITYVSIRHGGAEIGAGNEINGLTLGAVGSGTTVEHVEVYANVDDGIEWFGGTVNCKWMVSAFCGDDAFDWDQGFRGNGQFWFAIMDGATGDNGGELDGATPDGATPFSNPTIYNATWIGSGVGAIAENATATLFRDATGGTFANSIFTGFAAHAIEVEDLPAASGIDSRQRMEAGDLNLLNNIYFDFGTGDEFVAGELIRITTDAEDAAGSFLVDHLTANNNIISNPEISNISRITDENLDPRPSSTGVAYTSALATEPAGFFNDVDFKGAFNANDPLWVNGWTALAANGHIPAFVNIEQTITASSLNVSPNPIAETATVSFELPNSTDIYVDIVDITGKQIITPISHTSATGMQSYVLNTSGLSSGIYYVRVYDAHNMLGCKAIVK